MKKWEVVEVLERASPLICQMKTRLELPCLSAIIIKLINIKYKVCHSQDINVFM